MALDRSAGLPGSAGSTRAAYVVYVGFLLIFAVFAVVLRDDGFLTASNLLNIVQQTAPVTVMAIGMVYRADRRRDRPFDRARSSRSRRSAPPW